MSKSLFQCTKLKLGWNAQYDKRETQTYYRFFDKGRRGGVSCISNKYKKANNRYLKSYDPKQKSKHTLRCKRFIWLCDV